MNQFYSLASPKPLSVSCYQAITQYFSKKKNTRFYSGALMHVPESGNMNGRKHPFPTATPLLKLCPLLKMLL